MTLTDEETEQGRTAASRAGWHLQGALRAMAECRSSRERSLAITKLEEAEMWLDRHVKDDASREALIRADAIEHNLRAANPGDPIPGSAYGTAPNTKENNA